MEPITFELLDGYRDKDGSVHKTVAMHHITMKEQIKLKSSQAVINLEKSGRSLSSQNSAGQLLAMTEYQEFHVELLKLIVDRIGSIDDRSIIGAVLQELTARDIALMIGYHRSGTSLMLPVELVLRAMTDIGIDSQTQVAFTQRIKAAMGETPELTA